MNVSSHGLLVAGTRERFPGEIIPVGATQSHTKNNDETNYGAGLAIDLDYSTSNHAHSLNSEDPPPWLKISLGQVYCVHQVIRYDVGRRVWQTWTCAQNDCTGTGSYAGNFYMTISTEGAAFDRPPISDCSFGNTVTYKRKTNSALGANELVIIGKVTNGALGKIKKQAHSTD